MKRMTSFLAVFAAVSAVGEASGPAICDPQRSLLCAGLGSVFSFEENTDNPRWDENKTVALLEADSQNVARAAGKIDSYAASFVGTEGNYLYLPRGGYLGANFSVAAWIYPTSASTEQVLISSDEPAAHGHYVSLVPSSGQVKLRAVAYYGDGQGDVSVTSTSSMTLNSWHMIVWGFLPGSSGQAMYVQVDNGARTTVNLTYWLAPNANDLILGQRKGSGAAYTLPYSGRIDQLAFSSRYWDVTDASEFYNAGSGKAYPFVPSSYSSLNDGLVAYWGMDETLATGGQRADAINQNNATDPTTQVPSSTTAKFGNSAYRTVNGSRLSVTSNSTIEYSGDFTVGGWVYFTSLNDAAGFPIVAKANETTSIGEWYVAGAGAGSIQFNTAIWSGGSCSATRPTPSTGAWHFLVASYTASTKTCTLSIDNGAVGSSTGTTHPSPQSAVPLSFGGDANGSNGQTAYFDEWFVYKRVLTSTDITNLYNGGVGRTYPF
jgi:hypothetical protein